MNCGSDIISILIGFKPETFFCINKKFNAISKNVIKLYQDKTYLINWLDSNYDMPNGCIHFDSGLMTVEEKTEIVQRIHFSPRLLLYKRPFSPIAIWKHNGKNHLLIYISGSMHSGSELSCQEYCNNQNDILDEIEQNIGKHDFNLMQDKIKEFCEITNK
jgi:hypothetical protein